MNVDQIYHLQRDDAFAEQFSADKYRTFVAMPFSNRGGYPDKRIRTLLATAHEQANAGLPTDTPRRFEKLHPVDEITSGSVVITDEIIRQVLSCHFFWGDLTGCNFGVVLECGLALALKPNARVLLFAQDGTHSLHFDLSVTRIVDYSEDNLVEKIAEELVKGANHFEAEAGRYIGLLSSQLTPDAIAALKIYRQLWADRPKPEDRPSIWEDSADKYSERFRCSAGRVAFHNAVRELSGHRLFLTEYIPNVEQGIDRYGIHATKLGRRVIEHIWKCDEKIWQPHSAPTGPNLT